MPETEETFLDVDVGDAVELEAQPEGEYNLVCNDASIGRGDSGQRYIMLRLTIPDIMESKGVTEILMHPEDAEDEKQRNMRKLGIKRACEAFGVDFAGGFDVTDFINKEARAYLSVEDDEQYGRQNNVARWVSGPGESEEDRSEDVALA